MSADEWERHARWWRDNFTEGRDPEYAEQLIPLVLGELDPASSVLDLGCGEGQIARRCTDELLCTVVGVDTSRAQLETAMERGGSPSYALGAANALGVAGGSFDAVVACLVLEHVVGLEEALAESARVLRPGGRLLVLLNHPIVQTPGSGWVDDHIVDPPEQYWQLGPYLPEVANTEQVDPGVFITFNHRPLSRYINAAAEQGLLITKMLEPPPPAGFIAQAPEYTSQTDMPRVLFMRFELVR